jgi:hypothetical protein
MGAVSPYLLLDAHGRLNREPQPGQHRRTSRMVAIASLTALGQWSYRGYEGFRALFNTGAVNAAPARSDALFDDAWRITEQALSAFAREVREDGAQFALVMIPAEDAALTRVVEERLQRIADAEAFPMVALPPADPSAMTCHRHWDAPGHDAVAGRLAGFVRDQRWIP